jgi:hypothetical protein
LSTFIRFCFRQGIVEMQQFQILAIIVATIPSLLVSAEGDAKLESRRSTDGLPTLVMSVPGARLELHSDLQCDSPEIGTVACHGPMVEVIEGQCVPRQDLMSKQMIAAYVDEVVAEKMKALTILEVSLSQPLLVWLVSLKCISSPKTAINPAHGIRQSVTPCILVLYFSHPPGTRCEVVQGPK